METVNIAMLPQICPNHPDTQVVETQTNTAGLEDDVTLTRYACAAGAKCGQPLGWQFRYKTEKVYRYGPGRCNDPRMEQALSTTRYNTTTFAACLVAGVILISLITILLVMGVSADAIRTSVTAGATTTAATLIMTAATLFAIWRYRQRPPTPDFKIDAAEWNAAQAGEVRVETAA